MKVNYIRLALYTAIVYVATIILQVYTPATRGYFNLGETAIYIVAVMSSPLTAGLAGGIGSALADLTTGYGYFAPGTLIIKFTEGFLVSLLVKKVLRGISERSLKSLSVVASLIIAFTLAGVGYYMFSGETEIASIPINFLGFEIVVLSGTLGIPALSWLIIGAALAVMLIYLVLAKGRPNIRYAVSMILGGFTMVLGYFLYEYFIVNPLINKAPPEQALFEIPVNLGQVLIGMSVALPIATFVKEAVGSEFDRTE